MGVNRIRKKPADRRRASALAEYLTWPQVALNRHGNAGSVNNDTDCGFAAQAFFYPDE